MKEYHFEDKVITYVIGRAIPKPANEQNTDEIAPGRFLKWTSFRSMGLIPFYDERHKDGRPVIDHPFNNPAYKGARILIAGENFGTGSSREHAPQALKRFGLNGIIAESYADIFAENCANVGIVAVTTDREYIDQLVKIVEAKPKTNFFIDLDRETIFGDETESYPLNISEGTRQAFLRGYWDIMPVLQSNEEDIRRVEESLPYLKFE